MLPIAYRELSAKKTHGQQWFPNAITFKRLFKRMVLPFW